MKWGYCCSELQRVTLFGYFIFIYLFLIPVIRNTRTFHGVKITGKTLLRPWRFFTNTIVILLQVVYHVTGYHCVYALYVGGGTAAAVINKTLVNVGAIVAVSTIAMRTSTASEWAASIATWYRWIYGAGWMGRCTFVYILGASWACAVAFPSLR